MNKHIKYLFQIAIGVFVACLVLEGILHITDTTDYDIFANDPVSGLATYRPNVTFSHQELCYENTVKINDMGFHAPSVTQDNATNTVKIVVLGSSFVEGMQVPVDQMFPIQLEKKLNANPVNKYKYEVIPFGFSGIGTYQTILYYLRFASQLKPDLVISFQTQFERDHEPAVSFDVKGNAIITMPKVAHPFVTLLKNVSRKIRLAMNLLRVFIVAKANIWDFIDKPFFFQENLSVSHSVNYEDSTWNTEGKIIKALQDVVEKDRATFLISSWASPNVATSASSELSNELSSMSKDLNFAYIDLNPSIDAQERSGGKSAVWPCDYHFSEAGNQYAANAIYDYLMKHPQLLQKRSGE